MKHVRLVHDGREQWGVVTADLAAVTIADGRTAALSDVTLLPPITPGATIFALGLNYADHSAELGFTPPAQPLVFLKGSNCFTAHGGIAAKPRDAQQMHPECELVAVIGRTARHVAPRDALDYVCGYTVACDYAIRDYLENYYRPNLRVKNRDGLTPIGPWLIDASDIGDPQGLALSTTVNGLTVQSGTTADMVFPIAELVAYLSSFMTLSPGDMILTGTPHGVHFVEPGDEVTCTVERVGSLVHRVGLQG